MSGSRNRSATVEISKEKPTPKVEQAGQKGLASFFTSQEPSIYYDQYVQKQAAYVMFLSFFLSFGH